MDNTDLEITISGPTQASVMSNAAVAASDKISCWVGNYNQRCELSGVTDTQEHGQLTTVRKLQLQGIVPLPQNLLSKGQLRPNCLESWSKEIQPLLNLNLDRKETERQNLSRGIVGLISFKRGLKLVTGPTLKDKVICREFLKYLREGVDGDATSPKASTSKTGLVSVDLKEKPFIYTLVRTFYGSSDLSSHRVSISHFVVGKKDITFDLDTNDQRSILTFEPTLIKIANLGDAPAPVFFQQTSSGFVRNLNDDKKDDPLNYLLDTPEEMNVMGKVGKAQRDYHRLLNMTMEETLQVEDEITKVENEIKELKLRNSIKNSTSGAISESNRTIPYDGNKDAMEKPLNVGLLGDGKEKQDVVAEKVASEDDEPFSSAHSSQLVEENTSAHSSQVAEENTSTHPSQVAEEKMSAQSSQVDEENTSAQPSHVAEENTSAQSSQVIEGNRSPRSNQGRNANVKSDGECNSPSIARQMRSRTRNGSNTSRDIFSENETTPTKSSNKGVA